MHGAMGGGTNGAGHVNMGLPYKAYNAEQVSAMQVMVVGVHTEMAGYEQVGTLMQGTAGAIEAAGMGPVMHLAIGGGNIRLPSVARPTNALVMPPAYDNSFTEVMIGPEGADTMVELRGEWKDRIEIEAAIAEAVAIPQKLGAGDRREDPGARRAERGAVWQRASGRCCHRFRRGGGQGEANNRGAGWGGGLRGHAALGPGGCGRSVLERQDAR